MKETMTLVRAEQLFELPDPYDYSDVKAAYRRLIIEKHPDVRKDVDTKTANKEASEINAANKVLSNRCKTQPTIKFSRQPSYSGYASSSGQPSSNGGYNEYGGYGGSAQSAYDYAPNGGFVDEDPSQWDAPFEEVTWEDLVNSLYDMYTTNKNARRAASGTHDFKDDLLNDVAAGVFAWAARQAALTADDKVRAATTAQSVEGEDFDWGEDTADFYDARYDEPVTDEMPRPRPARSSYSRAATSYQPDPGYKPIYKTDEPPAAPAGPFDFEDYTRYDNKARLIKFLTGRVFLFVVFFILAYLCMMVATSGVSAFKALLPLVSSVILFLIGLVNLITGLLTKIIQKPLITRLDAEFGNRYANPEKIFPFL